MKVKVALRKHNERQGEVHGRVELTQVCVPSKLTNRNLIFLNVDLH